MKCKDCPIVNIKLHDCCEKFKHENDDEEFCNPCNPQHCKFELKLAP